VNRKEEKNPRAGDLFSNEVIKSYRASDPDHPIVFRRGDVADAEPAVPGWTLPVDDLSH
jgi:hypothetical protein